VIRVLFSMILGEAVDEGLIGTNSCRKLRITEVVSRPCSPSAPHTRKRPADEDHRQAV
jgi:hypothetical protein